MLRSLVRAAGIICFIYGALVLFAVGIGHWFNCAFLIIGAALVLASFLWERKLFRRAFLCVLAFSLIIVGLFEAKLVSFSLAGPEPGAAYIMVLGCKLNGSLPSREFSERIRAAAEYLAANPDTKVVTTGGRGADEDIPEGEAAKKMLIELGIEESRVIVEDKSESTKENINFAKALIEADGGSPADDLCVIASSSFHLYRSSLYARASGFGRLSFTGSRGLTLLLPHYCLREFAACVREFIL